MSCRTGAGSKRVGAQKHKNTYAFKNDLHDKTPTMKKINSLNVCEVCERCKSQIEWKIKYKKYKPLSQAKTCISCKNRTVVKAYHVMCKDCAKRDRVCAKCLKSADQVKIEPPGPTPQEQQKLQTEMDLLIKTLSERKRRTFKRYMKMGKQDVSDTNPTNHSGEEDEVAVKKPPRIPHTRDELLQKIENLRVKDDDGDDDDFEDEFDGEDDSDCDVEDDSDVECSDSDDVDDIKITKNNLGKVTRS